MATSDQYNVLQERKINPAERILVPRERSGGLTEPNFIPLERFLFPAEPPSAPLETKFALTEHYNVLSEQYPDLSERILVLAEQYPDLSERILVLAERGDDLWEQNLSPAEKEPSRPRSTSIDRTVRPTSDTRLFSTVDGAVTFAVVNDAQKPAGGAHVGTNCITNRQPTTDNAQGAVNTARPARTQTVG